MKYKAKRIRKGLWEYRGYKIMYLGYFEPEHRIAWEVEDVDGTAFGQSFTFRMATIQIDNELKSNDMEMEEHTICKVKIICPHCGQVCDAEITQYGNFPFANYVHFCEHCGYAITESEWQEIENNGKEH